MTSKPVVVAASYLALLAGSAILAAPGQDRQALPTQGTERPGQSTKGQVWIENRGRNEAIPVVAPDPLPVLIRNPVRLWDYQVLNVTPGTSSAELTRMLTASGNAGWEASGVHLPSGPNTLVVMKRPRPDPDPRTVGRPDAR
jgi:hypothetical protein